MIKGFKMKDNVQSTFNENEYNLLHVYQNISFFRAFERVEVERHRIAHLLTNFNFFNINNVEF